MKKVYNGRLISPGEGDGKTHNSASTTGCYWLHPGRTYSPDKQTFVTEGIINALSLIEIGHQAIAVLASGQDPTKVDPEKTKLPTLGKLVFAFDNDNAGAAATRKWQSYYPDATAIMPDKGQDWNDLLRSTSADQVAQIFKESYPRFELNARLALADSPLEYARIHNGFFHRVPGQGGILL